MGNSSFSGLLSVLVMTEPLFYGGTRLDLRGAPVFYISYLLGWKYGFLSTIIPTAFRIYLGGEHVVIGVMQSILLPFAVGSFFHNKKAFKPPFTIANMRHMLSVFLCYQLLRILIIICMDSVDLHPVFWRGMFETIAVITIFLMWNDVSRNLLLRKELEYNSRHDSMTNLYNIRYFRTNVEGIRRDNIPYVIAMFDVDDFKKYNDTHGHPAGDSVLRTIGHLLRENMRREDIFARYGGEEFIICFSNIRDMEIAVNVAERFRRKVEDHPFMGEETQPKGQLTISIGVSNLSDGKTLDVMIGEADQMLYKAKNLGRNRTMW